MHRKRFITNTVFLFGTSLIAQIISLFVLPLFIENLGKEMYGIFVISNMLMGYVGLLDFGFTDGLTRQIGRSYSSGDKESLSDAVSTGFWLLAAVGLVAGGLIYFGRFWFLDFLHVEGADRAIAAQLLTVTAIFSLVQWPMRLPTAILKATLHIKQQSIVQASAAVVSSLTMLILVLLSVNVVGIRLGVCVVLAASWLPMILLVKRYVPQLQWHPFRFKRETFREMSGFSLGMFYTKLLSMLSIRVDHLIIGGMIGVGAIAPYVIAAKLFEVVRNYTGKLFGALLPTVFNLDTDQNRHKLQTVLNDGVRYRALLITPLAYLGIIISPAFIRTWMGPEYVQYAIWSQLFMAPHLTSIFGFGVNIARGTGKLRACNILLTIRVLTNLIVSILLIPYFGIGGPVIGTVIGSTILGDIIAFPFFCRMCDLEWKKAWNKGMTILVANVPITSVLLLTANRMNIATWPTLLGFTALTLTVLYATQYIFFIKKDEKHDIFTAFEATGITRIPMAARVLRRVLQ